MRFANPYVLWLLLCVPLFILGTALRYGARRRLLASCGDSGALAVLTGNFSVFRRVAQWAIFGVVLGLLALSLARPQAGERTTLAPKIGIDVVVALDFSKSMLARDAYPSRLERAKAELGRLIDTLGGDRVGLVAFAGETISYPLTTDYRAAKLFWRDLSARDMPVGGTALGKAIVAATRLLTAVRGKSPPRDQAILLLTDGEDHESDPLAAAKEAARLGIRIFTVGIGSRSGEPIPELDADGKIVGYLSKDGHPVTTRLDHRTLAAIADATRAHYIEVEPRSFGVESLVQALKPLKRSEVASRLVHHYDDVYSWFLFPAFILLWGGLCLSDRRRYTPVGGRKSLGDRTKLGDRSTPRKEKSGPSMMKPQGT